mmetsp:Transcript_11193/g.17983  ORF Transcript_11193/g.17983 Transcript_11193/m.17983 type:complete len:470 (-) Transcript_11193:95-1504(-)
MSPVLKILYVAMNINLFIVDGLLSTRIAFGSCVFPGLDQSIFEHVVARNPDLFIFSGDITYLDSPNWSMDDKLILWKDAFAGNSVYKSAPTSQYDAIWSNTFADSVHFQQLTQQCPIIGILDDHDYGNNNCDVNNPNKDEAKRAFLEFFNVPKNDVRYKRGGLYLHYPLNVTFNTHVHKTVDIILLDIRYFAFKNETFDDILGEAQWNWLEDTLTNKLHHNLLLIVSPIPFLPSKRGHIGEQWYSGYPQSHQRLLSLLLPLFVQNEYIIFVTGDHHWAEIDRVSCVKNKDEYFEMHEIMSSGLTHTDIDFETNPAVAAIYGSFWALEYEQIDECMEAGINFGEIEIEWLQQDDDVYLDKVWMKAYNQSGEVACKYQPFPVNYNLQRSDHHELGNVLDALQMDKSKILYEMDGFKCFSSRYLKVSKIQETLSFGALYAVLLFVLLFPVVLPSVVMCGIWRFTRGDRMKTK